MGESESVKGEGGSTSWTATDTGKERSTELYAPMSGKKMPHSDGEMTPCLYFSAL